MIAVRLMLLICFALTGADSLSCVCSDTRNHKRRFEHSEYVFIGRAIGNLTISPVLSELLDESGRGNDVSFQVERVFKGKIESDTIAIFQNAGSCDMTFRLGDRYLVFGKKVDQLFDSKGAYSPTSKNLADKTIKYMADTVDIEKRNFETLVQERFRLILITDMCSCYYSTGKTFRKYMRRK